MSASSRSPEKPFQPIVLIPAYKPDVRLPQLVELLRTRGLSTLVVDDGSGEAYQPHFERCAALGARVIHHAVNLGKGRALKTGLNDIQVTYPNVTGVITADADGQHTPEDIHKVALALQQHPDMLIVGGRSFAGKQVPWKSRVGNALTRLAYHIATGVRIHDTQTGLRGLPGKAFPWMTALQGERYEYEMNMLLKLREYMLPVLEIPVETVYIDQNAASHFHPLRDGLRVYGMVLRYMFSGLLSFGADYALYLLGLQVIGRLAAPGFAPLVPAVSYAVARVCSSLLNYKLNKHAVFGGLGGRSAVWRYYLLAAVQMLLGAGLTSLLADLTRVPESIAKLPVDMLLFCASFFVQRDFVFRSKRIDPSLHIE
ncbi:MAG: bifunctional glycosyltransferase family 2/GtrA family protein [Clostridia bacterium]|nr:bifunctional glycosyltransferase family 2/GtrA family protein [Clostridia bacterium]